MTAPKFGRWKAAFLAHLRTTGRVGDAAKACGVAEWTPKRARKTDRDFAAAWDAALKEAATRLWQQLLTEEGYIGEDNRVMKPAAVVDELAKRLAETHQPGGARTKYGQPATAAKEAG